MDFFKKILGQNNQGAVDGTADPAFEQAQLFINEYLARGFAKYGNPVKLADMESWAKIKAADPEFMADICLLALKRKISEAWIKSKAPKPGENINSYAYREAELKLGSTLMRSKLPFSEIQLTDLVHSCAKRRSMEWDNPIVSVLGATERVLGDNPPGAQLTKALQKVRAKCIKKMRYSNTEAKRKIKTRIEKLLDPGIKNTAFVLPKGKWMQRALEDIAALTDKKRAAWLALLEYAADAKGSKPSQKWLKQGGDLITALGKQNFQALMTDWIDGTKIDPGDPDPAVDLIKGLVWLTANTPTNEMALSISRLGENCYVKVAGIGARSKKLGNACCVTLMNMPENKTAIAELVRLRGKIKYPSVRGDIQTKLEAIAEKQGVTVAELEDASLPDFGFDAGGQLIKTLGDFNATINLVGNKAVLAWADQNGKARKTVPAAVRKESKPELTDLKRLVKDMSGVLARQITSLEQSYLNDRSWDFASWQTRHFNHPVRHNLTRSLIWFITDGKKSTSVLPTDTGLQDLAGKTINPSKTAAVKLWHPLFEDTKTIVAWRDKIEELGLVQPFKQAHREVYVVTDAERTTGIYSNRFAAHVLRQHQFKALCEARGWTYVLQGMWDGWNIPQKRIPAFGIAVEYAVEMIADEGESNHGIALYLSSDQVRFSSSESNQMNIEDVPPLVFSEIMRDVDLFVAVTS
ncbi:MAG: DUF4132 domain-containing protein, partial [Acidimicrobiales bacterium]